MLIASLVLSAIMLVALNVTAFRTRSIPRSLQWCALGLVGGVCLCPTFMLHAALTLAVGLLCAWLAPRPRVFLGCTLGAFLVAYAAVGVPAWLEHDGMLRESAPVSVAERLAYEGGPARLPVSPPLDADVRLISVPSYPPSFLSDDGEQEMRTKRRVRALQRLHDDQVSAFVNSPGFGVTRGPGPIKKAIELPDGPPVPIERTDSSIPPESAASLLAGGHAALAEGTSPDIASLHRASVTDFAFTQGFGYMKDRDHVFGFRPHRISKRPTDGLVSSAWRFRRLELVSLLKHAKPAVYVSDSLPRMSELRHAATRPLDAFEAAALPRLAKDDLVVHATDARLRVLGSIRAAEACLACHSGKEGRLLGAFSYTLDRPVKE